MQPTPRGCPGSSRPPAPALPRRAPSPLRLRFSLLPSSLPPPPVNPKFPVKHGRSFAKRLRSRPLAPWDYRRERLRSAPIGSGRAPAPATSPPPPQPSSIPEGGRCTPSPGLPPASVGFTLSLGSCVWRGGSSAFLCPDCSLVPCEPHGTAMLLGTPSSAELR